jgi:hypothetical protein
MDSLCHKVFEGFKNPIMREEKGRGLFLAGGALGMMARAQGNGQMMEAPLSKQINFGRIRRRDLLRHLGRIPELMKATPARNAGRISQLTALGGQKLLECDGEDFGVEENFIFAVAYLSAPQYYRQFFPREEAEEAEEADASAETVKA